MQLNKSGQSIIKIANRKITNKVTMAQKESQAGNFTNLLILRTFQIVEYLNGIGSKRFSTNTLDNTEKVFVQYKNRGLE